MIDIIYSLEDGMISQRCNYINGRKWAHIENMGLVCVTMDNCPPEATHIINNEPVTIAPPPPTVEELLGRIRATRNQKLTACDWTQTLDAPLTAEQKAAWAAYRQTLRDFPEICDPENPVWPVAPK